MNATPSVAAPCAPSPSASSNNNLPADASAVGEFAAMLEALSLAPATGSALDAESEAVAGEEASASEAAGDGAIAALANGWPWLAPAAAPTLPAAGTSATRPDAASTAADAVADRPGKLNIAAAVNPGPPAAGAPDLAPRGKAAHAACADTPLPPAFTPTPEGTHTDAPASLIDSAAALAPTAAAIPAALSPSSHATPVHQAALASRPGEAAFAADLAAEVRVMVEGGLQEAELSLHPAELGPIQVQLRVHGASADISLAAANGFTRDGLAQALPELREMLASQGLQLGQAGVDAGRDGRGFGDGSPRQQQGDDRRGLATSGPSREGGVAPVASRRVSARTLLDLYA